MIDFKENNRLKLQEKGLRYYLNKLKENGRLFCLFPGVIMFGTKHEKILHAIEQNGFYYNLIIKSEKLWENLTNIDLYLLCFEK